MAAVISGNGIVFIEFFYFGLISRVFGIDLFYGELLGSTIPILSIVGYGPKSSISVRFEARTAEAI